MAALAPYARSVFVNCPFSSEYQPMFRAILFAVYACGYQPRCALEIVDSGQNRLSKIEGIIRQCRFGIHDISFMRLDETTQLPRFNMSFELGIFFAAKSFGEGQQRRKVTLILDEHPYRYSEALSDLSGQDISSHNGDGQLAIRQVRDWLNASHLGKDSLLGGNHIWRKYEGFSEQLPDASEAQGFDVENLPYVDTCRAIESWLKANA